MPTSFPEDRISTCNRERSSRLALLHTILASFKEGDLTQERMVGLTGVPGWEISQKKEDYAAGELGKLASALLNGNPSILAREIHRILEPLDRPSKPEPKL